MEASRRIVLEDRAVEWKAEGLGRWSRTRPGAQRSGNVAAVAEGHEAATMVSAPAGATSHGGGGRNKRGAEDPPAEAGGASEVGHTGASPPSLPGAGDANMGDADASDGTRTGKHRKQKTEAELREEADRKRAAELRQQEQLAVAAQRASHEAGAGGFGSDTALSMAAQKFVTEVQKATEQAHKAGVDPKAGDGRELLELTPSELKKWVTDNLGDETNGTA